MEEEPRAAALPTASPFRHRALPPSPRNAGSVPLHRAADDLVNELRPRYDRVSRRGSSTIASTTMHGGLAQTLTPATLPTGWVAHFSRQHGRMFYGSVALGKTVWSIEEARAADARAAAAAAQRAALVPMALPRASSIDAPDAPSALAVEIEVLTTRLKAAVALRRDAADALTLQEKTYAKEKAALETRLKEAELKIEMAESRAAYYATLRPASAATVAHPPRQPPRPPEEIAAHMIRRLRSRATAVGFECWKRFVSRLGELRAEREQTKLRAALDVAERSLAQFQHSQRVHASLPTAGASRGAGSGGRPSSDPSRR